MAEPLTQWRHHVAPTTSLIGLGEDGMWKTARAKEYPLHLSAGIGAAMTDSACRTPITPFTYDLDSFHALVAPYKPVLDPYLPPGDWGADYVASTEPVHRFVSRWVAPHAVSFAFTS